ncbi:MAG: branched-chain amino acid ABC transporter permease, partial [Deltaproteobacteria bacterium]|nr:branched-chain amino acid ABC transporter permease [Deltaproteobacteria bacterium]
AVTVLAGMGSIGGTLIAALLLGVAESLTATLGGPAWGMAVSFGILLIVLAIKPSGLFRR